LLSNHAKPLAAGGQDSHIHATAEQRLGQLGAGNYQVLAIVED